MTFSLFPKPTRFLDLLREQNRKMAAAVALLDGLLADLAAAAPKGLRIREIEVEGDAMFREIRRQLALTFVTPIDREDIQDVNRLQEEILDLCRVIATRIIVSGLTRVREPAKAAAEGLARIVERAGAMLTLAIEHKRPGNLHAEILELKRGADALLETGLAELYETRGGQQEGLLEVVRWTAIFDRIGQALHFAAALADTLEDMGLKYA